MRCKELGEMHDSLFSHAARCAGYTNTHTDAFEIFVSGKRITNVDISGGLVNCQDGTSLGIGIKVSVGGKLGYSSSTDLTPGGIKRMVEDAIKTAKAINFKDGKFKGFSKPVQRKGRDGLVSERILSLDGDDLTELAGEIYKESLAVSKKVLTSDVSVGREYGAYVVVNSEDIEASSKFAFAGATCYTTAFDGKERKTGFEFDVSRKKLREGIGTEAAQRALEFLDARPLGASKRLPCVLENQTAAMFFVYTFFNSINGRAIVEERSPFADKLGDQLASRSLTVYDDGQKSDAISTSSIDVEGVPMRTKKIIDRGVLKSFLFDTYFGEIFGAKSTGNAFRSGYAPHATVPSISPSTLVIPKGGKSIDSAISGIGDGIFVKGDLLGMGHANLITGDFSIVALTPMLVKNGSIDHPLQPITIAGNMYKALADIIEICSDARLVPKVSTPSIAFDGFTVSG